MKKIIIIMLFTLVSFTWGTTMIAMKIAVETIPPFFATGMRFLLAAPLLILLSFLTKSPLLFPPGQRYFQIFVSIFYFSIPFTLMLYGGSYVSSFIGSIIFTNMPIMVLIVSNLYLKKKLFFVQKIGIYIAVIMLSIILFLELKTHFFYPWKGILSLLLALFFHALVYAECQKKCCNVSVLTFNAIPSLISGILLSTLAWFIEYPDFYHFSYHSIVAVLYLGDFSGICGILAYFYLQKKVSAFYASMVFLILPLISGALEYYIYEYTISFFEVLFVIPLIIGILLTLVPMRYDNKNIVN